MLSYRFLFPAGKCKLIPFLSNIFDECNVAYDWDNEDSESYERRWEPVVSNKSMEGEEVEPSPWTYQSQWALKGTPYWGTFATYWGGGKYSLKISTSSPSFSSGVIEWAKSRLLHCPVFRLFTFTPISALFPLVRWITLSYGYYLKIELSCLGTYYGSLQSIPSSPY